jgi:hypothetical protein
MNVTKALIPIAAVCILLSLALTMIVYDEPDHLEGTAVGEGAYESIKTDLTAEDMFAAGYKIGDLVRITSGGKSYTTTFVAGFFGIGVLGGYISIPDDGSRDMLFGFYNANVWDTTGVKEGDKIYLDYIGQDPNYHKIPKYLQGITNTYDGSVSPEVYCNFRVLEGTGLKEDTFYRSATCWRVGMDRAPMIADMYEMAGINSIVSYGDHVESVEKCRERFGDSYYPVTLYDSGNTSIESIFPNINVKPEEARAALITITESEGKTAINCYLGKDRTGIFCAIMLALTGSSYEEVKTEYMLSYVNLFGIDMGSEEYEVLGKIMFDRYFYLLEHPEIVEYVGDFDWSVIDDYDFDLKYISELFLKEQAGMTDEEMALLMERISKETI